MAKQPEVAKTLRDLRIALIARKMSLLQLDILLSLRRLDKEDVSLGDLRDAVGVSKSTLSRSYTPLLEIGFVQREVPADDRRRAVVFLTASGKKWLQASVPETLSLA